MLRELRYIAAVGRFEKALSTPGARFGACALVFGENGWGKSTFADILRSLATRNSAILRGRKTLASDGAQKAVLQFDEGPCVFEADAWVGPTPRVAVYDDAFINANVFSGDLVSNDHLKNQYGLVVGEEGVRRVQEMVALDDESRDASTALRAIDAELSGTFRGLGASGMTLEAFLAMEQRADIDVAITEKASEVSRLQRSAELKAALEPKSPPLPEETAAFRELLGRSIDDVARGALQAVRAHIESHQGGEGLGKASHESWLEAGTAFLATEACPFCGQRLTDRTLVDAYSSFFSAAYRSLGSAVQRVRDTFAGYGRGDFRATMTSIEKQNSEVFGYWHEAAQVERPVLPDVLKAAASIEAAAATLDGWFLRKQGNLTEAIGEEAAEALSAWEVARADLAQRGERLAVYQSQIRQLKESIDPTSLPRVENELRSLQTLKRRYEADVVELVSRRVELHDRRKSIADKKENLREELNAHAEALTAELEKSINGHLRRLNAGFRIAYEEPDFRGGKEPAASWQILINEVRVSPRTASSGIDKPTFKNTLSAGDKSTLALALFLAKIGADPQLAETIVVLDDPFTSLDHFRRVFTAMSIRDLCDRAMQTIVLSHDKNFLRLLWEKIDQSKITSLALQTGAPGMTTVAVYDIAEATQPRHVTERTKIQEFVEGEGHEPRYIRTRLRTVCEDFYRKGDPGLFGEAASLEEIIRNLEMAAPDHPYKGALQDLRDINEYSRTDSHAERGGDPGEETSKEELRGFCEKLLSLTRGM